MFVIINAKPVNNRALTVLHVLRVDRVQVVIVKLDILKVELNNAQLVTLNVDFVLSVI